MTYLNVTVNEHPFPATVVTITAHADDDDSAHAEVRRLCKVLVRSAKILTIFRDSLWMRGHRRIVICATLGGVPITASYHPNRCRHKED